MASNPVYRELAAASLVSLPKKLHTYLANVVCKVFKEHSNPNVAPEESTTQQQLVIPLQWMLCGGDPTETFATLEERKIQSNFCGKVFKSGEPAYFCKDCQTDPTCCLCTECFEQSEHRNHRYRLYASGGGGCCDCGDTEAWTSDVYCQMHKPKEDNLEEVDPVESLTPDMADRGRVFFSTLLWYCMNLLSWEKSKTLPVELMQGHTADCFQHETFQTFLYNDEVHSYDEVIYTLTHNIKLTHTDAVSLATYVDRKGRAVAKRGNETECLQSKDLVNVGLASSLPLNVKVFHSAVAAHQDNAVLILQLLKELSEKSVAFRRLISVSLLEVSPKVHACILDRFFLTESRMWISARINWHRLLMSSIFMDPVHKKDLAVNLTKNYCELQKNFVADSHHHDVCASNMTVQLYTVPSLSRMLVSEHGLLETIIGTLLELLSPCIDQGTLRLRADNYKHSRIVYLLYDLRYALRNSPEEWTDTMRARVLKAYDLLLNLLGMIQNADAMKRQKGIHVERDDPWEHTFNLSIVLQPAVLLFVNWCISDRELLEKAVRVTLKKHEVLGSRANLPYIGHSVDQDLVGRKKMDLIAFDIMKEHVSVHQPVARVLACLLTGATVQNLPLTHFLQISPTDSCTPLFLMEHSSRAIVMAVQVLAGMWKRNGYSVVNQVINYQFYYSKGIMYDKDILMLQAMAAIMEPSVFMYALIYKFRLEKWLTSPDSDPTKRGETSEDALRFFISEAEEFLFLIITIFAERYSPNLGMDVTTTDVLRREIIHRLYIAPLSHSEILKQFRLSEVENEIDKLLKKLAILKRGAGVGKSVFELKKEFEKEFNPFFYHYTRVDHSKAEDAHRKKTKAAGGISRVTPAPPRRPPSFCEPYKGILRLSYCPVLHKVFHCVFKQAASAESKFWSDRLLHEALYLCALMLLEECPTEPKSLCNAATGRFGNYAFLDHLELLLPNQRAEEHRPLLTWIIQFLKSQGPDGAFIAEPEEVAPVEDDVQAAKEQLKEKAKARMKAHMSSMQKKYLEKNWKAIEEVDGGDVQPEVPEEKASSPRCAVGVASLLDHKPSPREVTCILCQEKSKDFAEEFDSQGRMFVQTVSVQKSTVLRRHKLSSDGKDVDFLSARADLPCGTFTGGCGHHVHSDCWKRFLDNKQQEHGRRHFFPIPGQSVQWHMGEFLCPLCQCFGNAVLPLLPQAKVTPEVVQCPRKELSLSDWRVLVGMALDLAENDTMDDGSSVDPTFHDKLCGLFPHYRKPRCHYDKRYINSKLWKRFLYLVCMRTVTDMNHTAGDQVEIDAFSQMIYMHAYSVDPDDTSDRVCLAQWNNCAYTIATLEMNARIQEKFLLETLSSRQLDSISSLVRLGCESKVRPSLDILGNYLRQLNNSFLLQNPPFTEFPCILEIDSFAMMINLHFTLISLFASLSSATGSLDGNPVIVPLMGATDEFLLRICTAAKVVQYLLTCSPAMETDTDGPDTEPSTGQGLQQLWIKFRKVACLSYDCPPSPQDLYAGLKDFLGPFLQCCTLLFKSLSHIDFIHTSGKMSQATLYHDLYQYLGLPSAIHTLFDSPVAPVTFSISHLAELWCSHPRLAKVATCSTLPPVVSSPRELLSLPIDFSELVKKASAFKCPNRVVAAEYSDSGQEAMMCLVCGEMLCTNSYCCQHHVDGVDEETGVGGFTNHSQSCGAGMGMALWILESYVVLLDATDITAVKGCTVTPPYLDEYGEPDTGLRRGNPLQLNQESYRELQELWYLNKIPERIHREMESNKGLRLINWSRM